jgi:hypothetical protein
MFDEIIEAIKNNLQDLKTQTEVKVSLFN